MTAEIHVKTIKRYDIVCEDCDVVMPGALRQSHYLNKLAQRHDKYCHGEKPIPHRIEHSSPRGILGGYAVTCMCGSQENIPTTNLGEWRCRLDKTPDTRIIVT